MSTWLRQGRALGAFASFLLAASLPAAGRADAGDARAAPPDRDEPQGSVDLDEIVVRVTRPAAVASAPGAAVTVVDAEQYAGEAKSVGEMVATSPGVAVRDYGGLGQLATVSIRGASADGVRVLIDGLPLNTAFGGGVDLSTIPRQWISSIEVVRGAEGARFGSGALGGAVNVVTRAPLGGEWSTQLSRGSFDTWSAGATAGFGGPRWGALVATGWDQTGGRFRYEFDDRPSLAGNPTELRWRENNAAYGGGLLAKGFLRAGAGRWDAVAQVSGGHRELAGSTYATTPDDAQDDLRAALVLRHARSLRPGLRATAEVTARVDTLDARIAPDEFDQRAAAGAAQIVLASDLGALALDGGVRAGGERLTGAGLDRTRSREELAAFGSGDLGLAGGRVHVGVAGRGERVGSFDGWSGKAGATVEATRFLSLSASTGRTFRAPSHGELYLEQGRLQPNPDLRPEEGVNADVAAAVHGAAGLARVTGFAQLYRDLIVYELASGTRLKPFNSARALVRGLEVEAATRPWGPARTSLSGSYTLLRSKSLRGAPAIVGLDLPLRARHRLFARVASEWRWLEAHAEAHHVSSQWLDTHNLNRIPAATTFNVGASWRVASRPEVRVHVDARNVANALDLTERFGNPLPGRMLLVSLRAGSQERIAP
ncbi:MAG TPA: TonB-dependent receptor [Anaeromyxobacteraceae bacterium]|nr:TonB-dependent receptor [Anaeromyxobacteraceae bacterium]